MSASADQASVLSREELGALLASLRDGRSASTTRSIGLAEAGRGELENLVSRFAAEQGRGLSTLYQTPIRFRFSHLEEIGLRQFAAAMLSTDRVARLDLGPGGQDAYLLLSRQLVFGWMMLAFGARPTQGGELIPARGYTRIEERFLHGVAEGIARTFAKALMGENSDAEHVIALEDPVALYDRSKRPHRVVSIDVEGLGEPSCLRIALPFSLIDDSVADAPVVAGGESTEIASQLLEMPVEVRVEVGSAELGLSDLAGLAVGDELSLEPAHGSAGLVVNVEATPKFLAEPGTLGRRLAVRITGAVQP